MLAGRNPDAGRSGRTSAGSRKKIWQWQASIRNPALKLRIGSSGIRNYHAGDQPAI
jgi:hypothetical protein